MLQSTKKMNEKHVLGVLERFCVTLKNNIWKTLLALKNPLPPLLPYPLPPDIQEWVKPFQYPVTMAIFHICLFWTLAMNFSPSVRHSSPLRCTKLWHWDDPSSSWPQSKVCQSSCICKRELDAGFVCVVVFHMFASMLLSRNTQNVIFFQGWWTRSK